MAIPGFSAELSFCKSGQMRLASGISSNRYARVIPQMRMSCVVDALLDYNDCLSFNPWGPSGGGCEYYFHKALWACSVHG